MTPRRLCSVLATAMLVACFCFVGASSEIITESTPVPAVGAEGGPFRLLTPSEKAQFIRGRKIFDRSFGLSTGIGPEFNGDACRGCHLDPVIGGAGGADVNVFRAAFDNGGQGPFQNIAPGQIIQKVRRSDIPLREDADPICDVFEQRNSPSVHGLGRVETVPDSVIVANEDPNDLNADGISGVARRVLVSGVTEIGRFGWKAGVPKLSDFARDALGNEIGVTAPDNGRGFAFTSDTDPQADPELSQEDLDDMIFFMETLAPPPRGGSPSPNVAVGEQLFSQIGCALCHIPSLQGTNGPVNAFSDFLLHNVAPPGFRGMVDGTAGVGEYRTPPLWGIRKTGPYMHDGHAETIAAAISEHFGEATQVKANYNALTPVEQSALLEFLNDL